MGTACMPEQIPVDTAVAAIKEAAKEWMTEQRDEIFRATGSLVWKVAKWLVVTAIGAVVAWLIVRRLGGS